MIGRCQFKFHQFKERLEKALRLTASQAVNGLDFAIVSIAKSVYVGEAPGHCIRNSSLRLVQQSHGI